VTLLQIVQDAADELGVPRPSTVITNTSIEVRRLLRLANKGGRSLAQRDNFPWQELVKEATHTTLAAEEQGALATIAPGFRELVNETIWDRTLQRGIPGPLSPQRWQAWKASTVTGPWPCYRIRDKKLYLLPAPAAGRTVAFEYLSNLWCQSSGGTGQTAWAADTDVAAFDEELLTLDLVWRFKHAVGRAYAEDFNTFEMQVANRMAANGGRRTQSLASAPPEGPNLPTVPDGNWLQ